MRIVTALRTANKRKQTLTIELDGEPWMEVDAEVIVKFELRRGTALDKADLKAIEREHTFILARRRGLRLCLTKARTRHEVERRLAQEKFPDDLIERVVAELRRQGILDDRDAARQSVRKGLRGKIGPRRMEAELQARGAAADAVEAELAPLRDPEWQTRQATELGRKRLKRLSGRPAPEQRRKVSDFLMRRGFDSGIVAEVLNELVKNE